MIVKQLNKVKPVNETPNIKPYNFQAKMVNPVPVPFSRQELLRRRAEEAAKHFMQSQAQSLTDPGINEYYAQGIRDKYDLADDTALRTAGQIIGGAVGVGFGIKAGLAAGASIGTFIGGPVGTAIGAVAGVLVGLGQVYLGAAIGGAVASPSGWYGSYDLMRSLLIHSVKNPISTLGTVASMSAGALVGSKLGGAVGGKVATGLGTILGTATGMTAGGIAFDKLEEELLKNRDLNAGLSPIMAVGNTMDQVTGANALKSSLLSLQGDGELLDNLSKAYGMGEDGFTRVDFSDIRKNTGLDIGVFGNGLIDYLGEVVMDPTNWAQWTFSGVNRKAVDTTEASLVAKAGRKFNDNRVNKVMELLEAKDVQGAAKVYKYLPTELKTEVLPTLVARQLSAGQMRQIGRIMLDSTIDNAKSMRDFKKIFITDPNLRSFVKDSINKGQDLNKVIDNLYDSMSADIMPKLSLGDIAAMKKIKANKRSVAENIEMMRKIDPNFDSFDYLPKHLQHEYRTKGFNFTPMHYKMLTQQYPGLKQYNDYLDTFNKTIMRISNPLMTLGLGGLRKLWDVIKHSDRGIKSLIKHVGKIEQGKVPFIEVTNKDGFLNLKKSPYFRKRFKELQDDYQLKLNQLAELKEAARKNIDDEVLRQQDNIEKLEKSIKKVQRKIRTERRRYQEELDFIYGQLSIYDGDTFIDATLAIKHKRRIAELKEKIQDPINSEHRADLELERIKLEGLLHQWDMLQGHRLVTEEAYNYYMELQHALDTTKAVHDYYEAYYIQHTKANTQLKSQWGAFDTWVLKQEGYKELVLSYSKDFDRMLKEMDVNNIKLLMEEFEISSDIYKTKKEYLRNHYMTKYFNQVKDALANKGNDPIKEDYLTSLDKYVEDKVKTEDINPYVLEVPNKFENNKQVKKTLESFEKFSKISKEAFQKDLEWLNMFDVEARKHNYFSERNEYGRVNGISPIETVPAEFDKAIKKQGVSKAHAYRILGMDLDEQALNVRKYLSYLFKRYNPQDDVREYWGGDADVHGYDMSDYETFIRDVLKIDIEGMINGRLKNELLLNDNVYIKYNFVKDNKKQSKFIKGFPEFFKFVDADLKKKFGGGDYFTKEYNNIMKKYFGSKHTLWDNYSVTSAVKKLYRLASKNYGTIQVAQNYSKIGMYTPSATINIIEQLYNVFLDVPGNIDGPFKIINEFLRDNPNINSRKLAQVKQFVLQARHSLEMIQRFPKEAYVGYPNNRFIGDFFDTVNIINRSGIFSRDKFDNQKSREIAVEKLLKDLELTKDNLAVKFIIDDIKSKFFNEGDPNSLTNKGDESIYLVDNYFTELDMYRSKEIYSFLFNIYQTLQGNITTYLNKGVSFEKQNEIGVEVNVDKELKTFYENIIDVWLRETVKKHQYNSIENDAFRFSLYDSSFEQQINKEKPFNVAELVRHGAPFTWRRADKLNLWSNQKRLLNTFTEDQGDIFSDTISLDEHAELLSKFLGIDSHSFKNYTEIKDRIRLEGRAYQNYLLETKGITARTVLKNAIFKVFDAETLGLLKEQSKYTFQIGGVDSEGNVINRLISDRVITKAIQQLTGITQNDIIAKGQSLETVMDEFYNWLYNPDQKNKTIVGHNIQFDLGHIKKDFELLGLKYEELPVVDTLWLAQRFYGEQLTHATLENVFLFLKDKIILAESEATGKPPEYIKWLVEHQNFHDASTDSIATLTILEQMLREHKDYDYLEQVRVDYDKQTNFLTKLLGEDLSRGFTEFETLYYGEDAAFAKAVDEIILEKRKSPEKTVRDIINAVKEKYSEIDFRNLPSGKDLDIMAFTADLLDGTENVMEFYRFTDQLKKQGFDSTDAKYMLTVYNKHYRHMDDKLIKYVQDMQIYNKDLDIDDVKKAYAYYMTKRFEDFSEFMGSQKTGEELIPQIEKTKENFRKGYDKILEAHKQQRENYNRAKELKKLKGGVKEKIGSTTFRDIQNLMNPDRVKDADLNDYIDIKYEYLPAEELAIIKQEIKAYRAKYKGDIVWNEPIINRLKAYEGEPGEWVIQTKDQADLSKIESTLYDFKTKTLKSEELIEEAQTLVKEEVFDKKDNSKRLYTLEQELRSEFTPGEVKEIIRLIKKANRLKIKTHGQETPEAQWTTINGVKVPVRSDKYVADFKQEFRDGEGYKEDGKDLLIELETLKKLKEKEIQDLKEYRESANKDFREKFGGFNEYETGKQSEELVRLLVDGDYKNFELRLRELLPKEEAKKYIKMFKEQVLSKLKGEHPYITTEFKRVHKIEDGYGDVPKEYYVTEKTTSIEVRDRDSLMYEMSGRAYYETWMGAEALYIQALLEDALIFQKKLDGTYTEQVREPGKLKESLQAEQDKILKEFNEVKPINNRVMEHEEHYTMDLGDIRSLFKDADELALFLKENPEYRLVGIGADNTKASKNPSKFRTLDDGTVIRKDNYLYKVKIDPTKKYTDAEKILIDQEQEYSQAERAELEAYKVGKYDTDKPAIKEILWAGTTKLQKLFDYDPSELSIGIMSIDNFKQAKERSYKPFQFPPVLDKFYKNIIRLQKSEMLVSGRWHATNIIDIIRKNSTLTDMFRDSKEYIRAFRDATELQTKWTAIQYDYVNLYKEFDARANEAYMSGDKEAIRLINQEREYWGSLGFEEYIRERGIVNITPETLQKTQMDSELDLGTYLYLKHKKNNSFKRLKTDAERIKYLQERADDYILELKMTDEYQTSTATTDLPTFIQKMDQHELAQSDSFTRRVFRFMSTENPIMKLNMKTATRIEQIGRLHGYLLDRYLYGTSHDAATHRSLQRHFDYSDRGAVEMYATLLFPFTAFPIRNALFWQNMLMDASMNRRLYHLMVAAWGSYDIEENEYAQSMQRQGYIPIGNTLMKIGDSRMSALQFGNSFGEVAQQRANPLYKLPLELLKGEQRPQDAILNTIPILRRIPGMVTQLQKGLKADQDDTLRRVFATGIGAVVGTAASPGIGTAIGGAVGAIGGGNAFPGIFGTIYNDNDYKNVVFTRRRYTYNNLYTKQGKLRTLSNNAYYRVRQIQYQNARRNYY